MIVSPIITGDYTIIPNALLNSSHISPTAKIIWQMIKSKGAKWNVYNEYLAKELSISVTTLKKYTAQLISSGWMSRIQRRNPKTGQLLGGFDYILHPSPTQSAQIENLLTDSVDNNERFHHFHYSISPNRQNLPPNKEIITNNILNNKPVVGLSASVEPVNNSDSVDELELAAANQYVDQQCGVRDRAAYLACTIRNGWHRQLYAALQEKNAKQIHKTKIIKINKQFKKLDSQTSLNLQQEIVNKLNKIEVENIINNNNLRDLIRCWVGEYDSVKYKTIIYELQWYYYINVHYPNMITKPDAPTLEHCIAYELASTIACQQ